MLAELGQANRPTQHAKRLGPRAPSMAVWRYPGKPCTPNGPRAQGTVSLTVRIISPMAPAAIATSFASLTPPLPGVTLHTCSSRAFLKLPFIRKETAWCR